VRHVTHTCTRHVTLSNETCHICSPKWAFDWGRAHSRSLCMGGTCHTSMWESNHTYKWVVAHVRTSHVTIMSHVRMSHVTNMNESRDICSPKWARDCGKAHSNHCVWVKHVKHTYEWFMSHIWMSRVTHMNESCHTHNWVMPHMCEWNMSNTYLVKSHIRISHVTHTNESCHTYRWVVGTHMNESCHTYECVMSHVQMSHVTRMHESCHVPSYAQACDWRRAHKDHYVCVRYVTNLLVRDFTNWNTSCHTYE